jgi:DNA-binding CsgD family transcriptional regulator/PAS domain-containing protein
VNASDTLLFKLYGCQDEPAQWTAVLDQLCLATGAHSAVLQSVKLGGARPSIGWMAADSLTLSRETAPAGVAGPDNPRFDARRMARALGRISRDEDLFDRDDPAQHLLHEQLAQHRLGRFIGSLQQIDADTYLGLALHRAVDDQDDFSALQAGRLGMLAPHFGQAIGLQSRRQDGADLDQRLRRHLDRLRCGLIVCAGDGRVQWMNRSAQATLAGSRGVSLRAGCLRAAGAAADARLRRDLSELADGGTGGIRYLSLGQGADCLHLALQGLCLEPRAPGGATSVLLAVTGAGAGAPISAAAIATLFGLTPAEACLVAGLVAGYSLEQYAVRRGVSLGTVRGQLKQVLGKTGATRQAELVRLVLSSVAAQLLDSATLF